MTLNVLTTESGAIIFHPNGEIIAFIAGFAFLKISP